MHTDRLGGMPSTGRNVNRLDLLGQQVEQSIMGTLHTLGIHGPPCLRFALSLDLKLSSAHTTQNFV